jgi:hypothetical protein
VFDPYQIALDQDTAFIKGGMEVGAWFQEIW